MHTPSRRTALATLALVLAPALSSCGFDYATDRDYTPGVGANDRSGQVDVLAGLVVTADSGESVFLASFSNNSGDTESGVEAISAEGLTFDGVEDLTLEPNGFINLANGETPVTVEGDVEAGRFVEVTIDFAHGESSTLDVPVVPNCGDYADINGVPAGDDVCEVATSGDH